MDPGLRSDVDDRPIVNVVAARWALGATVALYVGLMTYWTLRQHYGFATSSFDLGIWEQGVWLLSRNKEPFVTVLGLHLFGDHTSFFLVLVVPLFWLFSTTSSLLIMQTIALGIAAVPAFLIAREKLRHEVLALLVAVAYLAHPAVGHTNFENFHPDSFEVPLVFGVIYFMMKRRWLGYSVCLILLLSIKEDVPLMTFVLGIYVALRYDRRVGIITSAVSLTWFGAVLFLIFPAFNEVGTLDAWRIPSDQFGGMGGLAKTAFTRPWEIVQIALGPERPWYLWQMLAPVALLCLLAPGMFLVAIGPLMSNVLSTFWYQYQIEFHYGTLIVPILITAAVFGIARFDRFEVRRALAVAMVASAALTAYLWGPWGRHPTTLADPSTPTAAAIRGALDVIPDDAAVSAAHFAVPHLAHREHIYDFPVPWRAQNWGDWSQEGERLPFTHLIEYVLIPAEQSPELQQIADSLPGEGFQTIYERGGILVLARPDR